MQKISPFLWFDHSAEEAMNFYVSAFRNAEVLDVRRYGEAGPGPEGSVMMCSFRLDGQEFMALNGGPEFAFTPSVSFFVDCQDGQELDELWGRLADGGSILMPLDSYPFSERYGWVQDRFGISWQFTLTGDTQTVTPSLLFAGAQRGRAGEALELYTGLFPDSRIVNIARYGPEMPEVEGMIAYAAFELAGRPFRAMDSGVDQPFTFSEAMSFFIDCDSSKEVDLFWETLLEGGEPSQCGWLKDRFGVSWQVVPNVLMKMLGDPDPEKANSVMRAMMQMIKLDVAELEQAYAMQD